MIMRLLNTKFNLTNLYLRDITRMIRVMVRNILHVRVAIVETKNCFSIQIYLIKSRMNKVEIDWLRSKFKKLSKKLFKYELELSNKS